MRARVLYTNGIKTIDLFWLSHDGTDVYCGESGFDSKRSYHASGKVHSDSKGERNHEGWHAPLRELKGQFHLSTIALSNSKTFFSAVADKYKYSGRKSDAVLVIDSRSIPESEQMNVLIGLLEPHRLDIIQSLISRSTDIMKTKQVLLSTAVEPWVYVLLTWLTDEGKPSIESEPQFKSTNA